MDFGRTLLLMSALFDVWVLDSRAASVAEPDPSAATAEEHTSINFANGTDTNAADRPSGPRHSAIGNITSSTPRSSATDILGCLVRAWYSDEGAWEGCFDSITSFWSSSPNEHDEGRKKSKKKQWNSQMLMLGAGVQLILFLPILAVLTGKAISLSLTSLIIMTLAFLYKSKSDCSVKRSDSN